MTFFFLVRPFCLVCLLRFMGLFHLHFLARSDRFLLLRGWFRLRRRSTFIQTSLGAFSFSNLRRGDVSGCGLECFLPEFNLPLGFDTWSGLTILLPTFGWTIWTSRSSLPDLLLRTVRAKAAALILPPRCASFLIADNSAANHLMGFAVHLAIAEIMPRLDVPVILDYPVTDHRCRQVIGGNVGFGDIDRAAGPVAACAVEFVPIDDNRPVKVAKTADADIYPVDIAVEMTVVRVPHRRWA